MYMVGRLIHIPLKVVTQSSENRIKGSEDRAWGLVSNEADKQGELCFKKWFPLYESEFACSGWDHTFWYRI